MKEVGEGEKTKVRTRELENKKSGTKKRKRW
jgi:hypothetical protein